MTFPRAADGAKEGQGRCPWTPPKAKPLETWTKTFLQNAGPGAARPPPSSRGGSGQSPVFLPCLRAQYCLYARNFPLMVIDTRSPALLFSRPRFILKSIALMIPSPNSSWISALNVVPYTEISS